jgi:DNA polymerase-3 subunit epsilon/ATP-dependent DNA helicase DinG
MPKMYVALDTETTGFNPEQDAILEVGAVRFQAEQNLDKFHRLVNPGRPLPPRIERLTGIDGTSLSDAPSFDEIADDLREFVGDSVIVGHSVGFDLKFLRRHGLPLSNSWLDTFELAGILMPRTVLRPKGSYGLGGLADELNIPFANRHRALADAEAARDLLRALMERGSSLSLEILEEIERLARLTGWPLYQLFRDLRKTRVRSAFQGTAIGDQLRGKGLVDDALGLFSGSDEGRRELEPSLDFKPIDVESLAELLSTEGSIGRRFPGYELRPQQERMLRAVSEAFNQSSQLLVEGGAGTGKSLAYLLPAIQFAVENSQRVVISTNTINLQEQLFGKDIPDLKGMLPYDFQAALLKGRSHYLCRNRLDALRRRRDLSISEARMLAKVLVWLPSTVTGDRAELFLSGPTEQALWAQVCADADGCIGESCKFLREGRCFLHQARRSAEAAHLVIVNHSLLLSDAHTESRVLPDYEYLIVDEAHHLEEATTRHMSTGIGHNQIIDFLGALSETRPEMKRTHPGILATLRSSTKRLVGTDRDRVWSKLEVATKRVESTIPHVNGFFSELRNFLDDHGTMAGAHDQRTWINEGVRSQPGWSSIEIVNENLCGQLESLAEALAALLKTLEQEELAEDGDMPRRLGRHLHEAQALRDNLLAMVSEPSSSNIYWAELRTRGNDILLRSAPLQVGETLRDQIFSHKESIILTSATLQGADGFKYIRETLGLDGADELSVGSPFDFSGAALVCLPTDIPEPGKPFYQKEIEASLIDICKTIGGRTLVLFTSNSQLEATYRAIADPLEEEGVVVLGQGQRLDGSRSQVLESFRSLSRSVLLGSRSFWEGVDVVGPTLSCVVIVRLPFSVPTDPIFAARSQIFEDSFYDYAMPQAVLSFRQGFGRLIRSQGDRGAVIVLDRRITTKSYGHLFLDSLPQCQVIHGSMAGIPKIAADWIRGDPVSISKVDAKPDEPLGYESETEID